MIVIAYKNMLSADGRVWYVVDWKWFCVCV